MQEIDQCPGNYYVSVRKGGWGSKQYRLLRGPFPSHVEALAAVEETTRLACALDPRGHWYFYGTARLPDNVAPMPGILNDKFPAL